MGGADLGSNSGLLSDPHRTVPLRLYPANSIGEAGARALAESLKGNTTLTSLDLPSQLLTSLYLGGELRLPKIPRPPLAQRRVSS